MVRHKVMTTVSTFDARGQVVRDTIKIGGRIKITRSRIEVNCDVASAQNQVVTMTVDVDDDGRGTVSIACPTTLMLTINKPDQNAS